MPNLCAYAMRVKGTPEAIDEMHKRLTDYEHTPHFWRVFEAERSDAVTETDDGETVTEFYGTCAWSVNSCMLDNNPLCYANEYAEEGKSTSLEKSAKELGIDIEVYSEEGGNGFAEHYLYTRDGSKTIEEETDFEEFYWDRDEFPTFDEFIEEYGLEDAGLSEEDFEDEEFVGVGGYEENWAF